MARSICAGSSSHKSLSGISTSRHCSFCVLDTDVSRFARFARNVWGVEAADDKEAALAGIAAQEAFFRSIGMPVRVPALSCGRQDEAGLADLASRCSYGRTRTIGTFRVLGYDDILAIYQLANNEE